MIKIQESFTPYDDMKVYTGEEALEGMIGNASDDTIDKTIRILNRIARSFKVRVEDIIIAATDGSYNPEDYWKSRNDDVKIKEFDCDGIKVFKETLPSSYIMFLYFDSEQALDKYLELYDNKVNEEIDYYINKGWMEE